MDVHKTANFLEKLIKDKIKELGLVKSGKMMNSIKVIPDNELGFSVKAVDYFEFLNQTHNIINSVIDTKEFVDYFSNDIVNNINDDLA